MAAPVFLRNQYSDLFGPSMLPVLEELFMARIERHPMVRDQVFKTVPTERDIWQASEVHDMPLFNQVAEGTDYTFSRPKQGASKTLTINKYGLGFSISEEAVDDGKFDMIADAVQKMAKSALETQEIAGMAIFNNGFGSEVSADGQPVFDLAHTLPSGLAFRNELSSPSDLSATSLETMLTDFETQFIGDSGIIYKLMPKVLLVHPSNKRLAKELIGSDLKPDVAIAGTDGITNINNMNSFKEEGLRVVSSPHLTDADAWFMLAAPEETGLRIVNRKGIETKASDEAVGFINDSLYYKARYREAIGVTHPYGVFGSPGSG